MNVFLESSISSNVSDALSSMALWNAIIACLGIILVGYFLRRKNILPQQTASILTKVVLKVALPALAFKGFMSEITPDKFKSALLAFVFGFIMYIFMIFFAKVLFKLVFPKMDKNRRIVFEVLFAFGSTTFFGQPIISAVFPGAVLDSNLFNIAYRVFLYSYAYIAIANAGAQIDSNHKMTTSESVKKMFLNPIIIATLVGFVLWALQLVIGDNANVTVNGATAVFYRIDVSLPPLYTILSKLGSLCSPLVWIAIGAKLAEIPLKQAATDKEAWIYSLLKNLALPAINILILLLINAMGINVSKTVVQATTIMLAAPPATVAVTYCISMDRDAVKASNCSLLSTIVAVVAIPIWVIVITVLTSGTLFA